MVARSVRVHAVAMVRGVCTIAGVLQMQLRRTVQVRKLGATLGDDFKGLDQAELLERLRSKSVKESCKTVRLCPSLPAPVPSTFQSVTRPHAQGRSRYDADVLIDDIRVQVFVMALVKRLRADGHRTLVFSQSRVMLDVLQAACRRERVRCVRIDGSITSAARRQDVVDKFQRNHRIPVFLLTSQAR